MITYAYASRKAKEYLMDSETPVRITYEGEFAEGWYFCYQSEEFLETGELSAQLAGNAPFLIDRQSGELHVLGTAKPLESYLEDYIKNKAAKSMWLNGVKGPTATEGQAASKLPKSFGA